jgi:hypothetical protein
MESWELGDTQNDEDTKLVSCLDAYKVRASWEAEMHSLREGSNIFQMGFFVEYRNRKLGDEELVAAWKEEAICQRQI